MPKTTLAWNPDDYVPVRERVDAFRATYPTGRIVTEMISESNGRAIFRAFVYRLRSDTEPAATGWASERQGDGEVNQSAHLENAETSAVGRALANLGFHGTRVSRRDDASPVARRPDESALLLVREPPGASAARDASVALQKEADARLDALLLLEAAERAGFPPRRAGALRRGLTARSVAPSTRLRAELELRAWFRERRERDGDGP